MNHSRLLLAAVLSLSVAACGSAIASGQTDGQDCNVALAAYCPEEDL